MSLSGFISFLFDIFDIPPHRRITRRCTPHSQPSLKSRSVWAPVFYFIFYISWSLLNGCFRSTTTEYVRTTVESALERSVGGDGIVDQICFFFFLGKAAAVHCVFVDLGWDREGVCICAVVGKLLQVVRSELMFCCEGVGIRSCTGYIRSSFYLIFQDDGSVRLSCFYLFQVVWKWQWSLLWKYILIYISSLSLKRISWQSNQILWSEWISSHRHFLYLSIYVPPVQLPDLELVLRLR